MAAFVETGSYLKFIDRPRSKSKAILWPILVHRVLYPEPRQPELNLFQRAVLGLIRAKRDRQDDIAALTGLHPELIALIVAQGISHGLLTSDADALTDKGHKLLDDEEDESSNLKAGFLIQDAISGNFWPRMVTRLEQIEPLDPQARFPVFSLERRTGHTFRPYLAGPKMQNLPALDNESLARAYRDYRKDFRASQQLHGGHSSSDLVRLQGFQRLDDSPEAARLVVWVTGDEEGDELWSVKDPFGLRESAWWLEQPIQQLLDSDTNLRKFLAPLIGIPDAGELTNEEWMRELQKRTELDILIEYPWVEAQSDIRRYFARLLKWQRKIESGTTWDSDLEAALGDCQKLLEVVMQWLIRTYPANVGQLPPGRKSDWSLNERLLGALGIPSFTHDVVRTLARQDLRQIIRACQNPTSSLKALLFAAGMGALNEDQHPLKILEAEDLQMLKLLDLADLRNQSSHGQSRFNQRKSTEITQDVVIAQITYAKNFTECFKDWM
ncbi:hypothetical protein [Marinobacter sp. tcs-11]|uniref:hypothetical protein n=1 Tax=Marinobacter sp. tcs-11 TaxID=1742860 RepID=UPI00257BEBB2|nr:hypothetical protein [Marinobacter sp. tcs-11]